MKDDGATLQIASRMPELGSVVGGLTANGVATGALSSAEPRYQSMISPSSSAQHKQHDPDQGSRRLLCLALRLPTLLPEKDHFREQAHYPRRQRMRTRAPIASQLQSHRHKFDGHRCPPFFTTNTATLAYVSPIMLPEYPKRELDSTELSRYQSCAGLQKNVLDRERWYTRQQPRLTIVSWDLSPQAPSAGIGEADVHGIHQHNDASRHPGGLRQRSQQIRQYSHRSRHG